MQRNLGRSLAEIHCGNLFSNQFSYNFVSMRTITQIIILVLLSIASIGQSDFRNGYIVNNDGSRVEGQVDFRSNDLSYKSCRFKKGEKVVEYQPNDIIGYGFIKEDRYYTSELVKGTFVELLIDGYVSFYKHGLKYYVQKENEPIDTIKSVIIEKRIRGSRYNVDIGGWKDVMKKIAADCNDLKVDNQGYKVNEQELVRFIKNYHKCKSKEYKEYKDNAKFTEFRPVFAFGISDNTIKKVDSPTYFYLPNKFDKYNGWVGAYLQIGAPRLFENVFVQIGAEYHKNSYVGVEFNEFGDIKFYETQLDLSTISVPINLLYVMDLNNSLKLNLQTGFIMDYNDGAVKTLRQSVDGQNVFLTEFESFQIEKR